MGVMYVCTCRVEPSGSLVRQIGVRGGHVIRVLVAVSLLALCGACGADRPTSATAPDPPLTLSSPSQPPGMSGKVERPQARGFGIVRLRTADGVAAVEVVVEDTVIDEGEAVVFRLVNRGQVEVLTGLGYDIQRWTGRRWVTVPWRENRAFPRIAIWLSTRDSTEPEGWSPDDADPDARTGPGRYRVVKSATYAPARAARAGADLTAYGQFEIEP